ncbi:heterokaryon incompatibility protein-domain-containing protein [Xylariales sp. PMI_506]|nr:heterokaryon incompatibility protein-domain-containing protein [Xylariales sp. PMI_506]
MAPMQRFRYGALSDNANCTRLIKLLPATNTNTGETIRIEISEHQFDSDTAYEAVSYTWDDQKSTKQVICNEKALLVTHNVFLILQRLRSTKNKERILWIDSISINQADEDEKAAQVSSMGRIYRNAKRVNIWLSHATAAMQRTFEYIRLASGPEVQFPPIRDGLVSEINNGFRQLCSHRYWTRIWTIQEVVLNENGWVYLALLRPMKFSTFHVFLWEVEGFLNVRLEQLTSTIPENLYPVSFSRGSPSCATRLHSDFDTTQEYDEVLPYLMAKTAKNPLDLVFACRALLPETFGQIKVDYTRNLPDVLREMTALIIPKFESLGKLLCLVCHCPPVSGEPSWTLNLLHNIPWYAASPYYGVWRAAEPMGVTACQKACVGEDGKTLCVRGIIIDEVALASPEFPRYSLLDQKRWHRNVHALLRAWENRCRDTLTSKYEVAIARILYAALRSTENAIEKFPKNVKFERVFIQDDDGTVLNNTVYKIHHVEPPDEIDCPSIADPNETRTSAVRAWLDHPSISSLRLDIEDVLGSRWAADYLSTTHSPALSCRSLFVTRNGKMGLCKNVLPGDVVALISTCELPFVLRPVLGTGTYALIKPAVFEGVMLGEEWPQDNFTGLRNIEIV